MNAVISYLTSMLWTSGMLYFAGHQPFPLCLLQGAIVVTGLAAAKVVVHEAKQLIESRKSSAA